MSDLSYNQLQQTQKAILDQLTADLEVDAFLIEFQISGRVRFLRQEEIPLSTGWQRCSPNFIFNR